MKKKHNSIFIIHVKNFKLFLYNKKSEYATFGNFANWDHEVNTSSIRNEYKNFKKKVKTKTDQEWSAFVWIANPQRLAICFLIIFKRFSTENSI